ncbi:rRNA-processing protein FCF1 [Nocardiopsis mwathae]|uniref:rRNA-processing protein FCF1 n=1 Tax=Nocardiopsis mwathae TaxID=1472723 RepID=A0A7X0D425_9ACTN|nr:antitoxin [Nocardiopsis mwathae]MBB6170837.1 rRNA-processing protein FCF1 [Nocardiopsis mwathae]
MSGLKDAMDKLKKAAGRNRDKVAEGVDAAAEAAKEKTGGKYDEQIDKAAEKGKDILAEQDEERKDDRDR